LDFYPASIAVTLIKILTINITIMKTLLTSLLIAFVMIQNSYSNNTNINSFNVTVNNEQVELNWNCEVFDANCVFIIERGDQSFLFSSFDTVSIKGGNETYNYSDKAPLNGISYYRLKCITQDGKEMSSKIGSVEFISKPITESFEIAGLFPVPFAQNLNLSVKCKYDLQLTIRLRDQSGKLLLELVKNCNTGYNNFNFSEVESLKSDTYYLTVSDENMNIKTLYIAKSENK